MCNNDREPSNTLYVKYHTSIDNLYMEILKSKPILTKMILIASSTLNLLSIIIFNSSAV